MTDFDTWSDKEEIVIALALAAKSSAAEIKQMLLEMARSTRSEFEVSSKLREMRTRAAA